MNIVMISNHIVEIKPRPDLGKITQNIFIGDIVKLDEEEYQFLIGVLSCKLPRSIIKSAKQLRKEPFVEWQSHSLGSHVLLRLNLGL